MIHDNAQKNESASFENSIRVGAFGWHHPHWQGIFYPDDLPDDWRLSYYANEFSTVLIAEDEWRTNLARLGEWVDEVPQGFLFYFQSIDDEPPELAQIKTQLGDCFAGILSSIPAAVMINLSSKNLREWREWLEQNGPQLRAIFIVDENVSVEKVAEFKSLVEMLNL